MKPLAGRPSEDSFGDASLPRSKVVTVGGGRDKHRSHKRLPGPVSLTASSVWAKQGEGQQGQALSMGFLGCDPDTSPWVLSRHL